MFYTSILPPYTYSPRDGVARNLIFYVPGSIYFYHQCQRRYEKPIRSELESNPGPLGPVDHKQLL